MLDRARELREVVVRGLAKVGLVWALAVLGMMFVVTSAQGDRPDGGYSLRSSGSGTVSTFSYSSDEAPRTAGLALTLVVLAGGITVLTIGATRSEAAAAGTAGDPDPASDLPLALGLGLGGRSAG